jgi:tetracycline resistance efflux pump
MKSLKSVSTLTGLALLGFALFCYIINWHALTPAFTVLGVAIITKKALEPLIVGCAVGFALLAKQGGSKDFFPDGEALVFPLNMFDGMFTSIARDAHDQGLIWVILVCILYGAFVQLVVASGGIGAIGRYSERFVKNKRQSLIMTYLFSFFFFLDDYLSALSVGNTMRPITDSFGVSRHKLAMVITFVCVPLTVIFPISTWTIFYGTQLVGIEGGLSDAAGKAVTSPIAAFLNTIPFNFAAIISLIIGFIYVMGWLPDTKGMQAQDEKIILIDEEAVQKGRKKLKGGRKTYFGLPLVVLIWCTILPYPYNLTYWGSFELNTDYIFGNIDALRGVATAVVFTYVYFMLFGILSFEKISKNFIKGLETMTFVLVILGMTYLLKDVQNGLGFNEFVVAKLSGISWLNGNILPFLVFAIVSWVCWTTGSNWGIYAILVPTVALLSHSVHANFWLTQGALASGSAWGAAACLFSDNRVLTAQSCKVDMIEHGTTQLPYQLLILVISLVLYLIGGYII